MRTHVLPITSRRSSVVSVGCRCSRPPLSSFQTGPKIHNANKFLACSLRVSWLQAGEKQGEKAAQQGRSPAKQQSSRDAVLQQHSLLRPGRVFTVGHEEGTGGPEMHQAELHQSSLIITMSPS
ncbi:uncharacterized protein LOC144790774 [Lissotriton helveticus]